MVVIQKSKDSVPTRRRRRLPRVYKEQLSNFTPLRTLTNNTHIDDLPDELLTNIFRYFSTKELYCNIRPVSRRWMVLAKTPVLWKKIDVKNEIPTNTLTDWIKTSPLLRIFSMQDRNDANVITEVLAKSSKNLESVRMRNCWGNPKSCLILSNAICKLVMRCRNLYNFDFSHSRFNSRKFFHLISRAKRNGRFMKKCHYMGPMTAYQMKALFAALKDYEADDTSTIGMARLRQKFKLVDIIRHFQDIANPSEMLANVSENLNYGQPNVDEVDLFSMQMGD